MGNCLNCGHRNFALVTVCEKCGVLLQNPFSTSIDDTFPSHESLATQPIPKKVNWFPETLPGTTQFDSDNLLVLQFPQFLSAIVIRPTDYLRIGRKDPERNDVPEIDLTPYGAVDKGISRLHAAIYRTTNLFLVDLCSLNGTFVEGKRLVPNTPYILRNRDQIQFAKLTINVFFETDKSERSSYV
jgi:hypothetical protein